MTGLFGGWQGSGRCGLKHSGIEENQKAQRRVSCSWKRLDVPPIFGEITGQNSGNSGSLSRGVSAGGKRSAGGRPLETGECHTTRRGDDGSPRPPPRRSSETLPHPAQLSTAWTEKVHLCAPPLGPPRPPLGATLHKHGSTALPVTSMIWAFVRLSSYYKGVDIPSPRDCRTR